VKTTAERSIGVFDSGIGGLTVLSELSRLLPHEDFIYVGDTARVPYGTKSPDVVRRYAYEIALFLMRHQVKMLVAACNTVSAVALGGLKKLPVPVVGVIKPGASAAVRATRSLRVGVIGTPATISSGSYQKAIQFFNPDVSVFNQACALFVPFVEEGWINHPSTKSVAQEYLKPLLKNRIDTLVLGCTHYPLLKGVLKEILGQKVAMVDSASETAQAVKVLLQKRNMMRQNRNLGNHLFFSSDDTSRFALMGERFLGWKALQVHRVRWS